MQYQRMTRHGIVLFGVLGKQETSRDLDINLQSLSQELTPSLWTTYNKKKRRFWTIDVRLQDPAEFQDALIPGKKNKGSHS